MTGPESKSPAYWRRLEELADSPAAREALADEFPGLAAALRGRVDRRTFMKLVGATLAIAGLGGCEVRPARTALPYVDAPSAAPAGTPLYFTTTSTESGEAIGVIAKSVDGRPIKLEGNPAHPASLGATDRFTQAAVWSLFDPTRAQTVTRDGKDSTWGELQAALNGRVSSLERKQGAGLRILTEPVLSPSLAQQLRTVLAAFPKAQWHVYAPFGDDPMLAGTRIAFGEPLVARYDLARAQTVFSLDADFLDRMPGHLAYARGFMRSRTGERMNRLYMVESTPTVTGANADHRAGLRAASIARLAFRLAHDLGVDVKAGTVTPPSWYAGALADLQRERGTSLVIAGRDQPPSVHALACAMNAQLGNIGQTVTYAPSPAQPGAEPFAALVADMVGGRVDTLLILGGNPVYSAAVDLDFARALARVPFSVTLSLYKDETAARARWHVPAAHFLESWGDARAYDGSVSLVQPLIEPLYGGITPHEILAAFTREPQTSAHAIVRKFWSNQYGAADFEAFWATALRAGVIAGTAHAPTPVSVRAGAIARLVLPSGEIGLELRFVEDATVGDGRFAGNAWLQELPKPLTKLTWDNAAFIAPAFARARGLRTGDIVTLRYRGRALVAPVWVLPGQPEDSVALAAGYGRAMETGDARGVNAYALRTHNAPAFGEGLELEANAGHYEFASTQGHQRMDGRDLVREALAGEIAPPWPEPLPSLYPPAPITATAWGMAIDLTRCIGCSACIIACQAENNIPVVGKDEVLRGHEMHWLRIDRYYRGEPDDPHTVFQPVPCMHCEHAPCEIVCPVGATLHDYQGLNLQVYNRCVGTRFCSNNCPYKVRRFNWFDYSGRAAESVKAVRNPDVTVRERGVMEKCTYCVQRIAAARIAADKDDRAVRDGEVVTACQGVCPTQAILFGDVHDPDSAVSQAKASPWNYALLHHLGTRPRTTYLTRLSNPRREEDGDRG